MAVLTPGAFTYSEWALRHDPGGKIATLVDLLSQNNEILNDMLTVECQSGNAFEYTQVVKLPTPQRRIYNQGVNATQAGVAKSISTCVEYADWSKVDASLAELGGQPTELRGQEDALHMEGFNQSVASDLFYSNRLLDPTAYTGLANIYNTVNPATSPIAGNVIDCGGTGSTNCSMWLVVWGPKQIHCIHPKGSMVGLKHENMGKGWALDANNKEYLVYRTYMEWKLGLAIHDWRYCVRAANIDVTQLNTGGAANLINILARMVHRPPTMPAAVAPIIAQDGPDKIVMGRPVIYVNRTLATYLDIQAQNKTNVLLQMQQWDGHMINTYRGIPIRNVDALLDTETRVV